MHLGLGKFIASGQMEYKLLTTITLLCFSVVANSQILEINEADVELIESIAARNSDGSVLMISLNRYISEADYPNGQLYKDYMAKI